MHYPGEMGGDATAALLFGDASPSGRGTVTVYREAYLAQRRPTDMALAPHGDVPGITYLYYDGPNVLYPFGHGLSYASFSYAWLGSSLAEVDVDAWAGGVVAAPSYAVNVTNTGAVMSDVSVLAFLSTGLPNDPLQQLFDFQRAAALAPGQTVTLFFTVPLDTAARVSSAGEVQLTPGALCIRIGDVPRAGTAGSASATAYVVGRLVLTGSPRLVYNASAAHERYVGRMVVQAKL
jgi:beta-D-xylosidase 4